MEALLDILPNIIKFLDLHYFNISGQDLEKILLASSHISYELVFTGSDIIISEPMESILSYTNPDPNYQNKCKFKIEHLGFDECTIDSLNGEDVGVGHLIDVIVHSELSESLVKIDRWNCNISADKFRHLLAEKGVTKIWIEE